MRVQNTCEVIITMQITIPSTKKPPSTLTKQAKKQSRFDKDTLSKYKKQSHKVFLKYQSNSHKTIEKYHGL